MKRLNIDITNILAFQFCVKEIKTRSLLGFLRKSVYLCSVMMKKYLNLFAVILILTACHDMRTSDRLNQIDSLVVREQYDSAYAVLNSLNAATLTADDQAHYCLLSTQLGFITSQPLPSDSLLDLAIAYYKEVGNLRKLADCYYYKSFRLQIEEKYPQAILYGKEAACLAANTDDARLQFKIAEILAYLNGLCDNNQIQLQYSKKALVIAQRVQNNNWIAYSYNRICYAFANLNQYDSVFFYIEKAIPYINDIYDSDKAEFYTNIAVFFKDKNPKRAKELLEKALVYNELAITLEHLADIYYAEGNKEKAYSLWKKALSSSGGIDYEKDNLIHSILSYDIERGKLDEASKYIDEVIAIKDSIITVLRNDTIKDLQLRFDHEVAMHEADKKLIGMQRLLMGLVLVMVLMALYIYNRRKKEETLQREHQMQLFAYTTEISQLKENKDDALVRIRELESNKDQYHQKISQLEEEAKNADIAIQSLNKDIKKLLNDEAPKLKKGKMLYDHIMDGKTAVKWSSKEEKLFNNYYAAINYQTYNRLRKVKRVANLSAHNMFYLILKEMGKTDEEIRSIMALSQEGLRTIRNRTKPKE